MIWILTAVFIVGIVAAYLLLTQLHETWNAEEDSHVDYFWSFVFVISHLSGAATAAWFAYYNHLIPFLN